MGNGIISKFIFLILITFSLEAFAKIIETADIEVIRQETSSLGSKDLVAFDVVNVLFSPTDKILRHIHKKDYGTIINSLKTELGTEKADILKSIILTHTKQALVDEGMPALIKSLQKNNVKVVALTSSRTGSFGKIPDLENLRLKTLKNLGIDFSDSFPKVALTLSDITGADRNHPPTFKGGVIFTSRMEKGLVLKSFLNKVNFIPKKIVFVDNKLRKIKSVEAYCKENGIKFTGIHYTKSYLAPYSPYDKDVVAKQFEVLKTRNIWPSDDQTKCLLDNPGKYKTCLKG
jgi:hypothetical protein